MDYLVTDERREIAESLSLAREQAERLAGDDYAWRWIIVALHSALQASLVCAIAGSDKLGAHDSSFRERWHRAYRNDEPLPEGGRLAAFPELYKRFREASDAHIAPDVDADVRRLNRFRNRFTHYPPSTWALEIAGLPRIALAALTIIDHAAWDQHHVLWFDADLLERARNDWRWLVQHFRE